VVGCPVLKIELSHTQLSRGQEIRLPTKNPIAIGWQEIQAKQQRTKHHAHQIKIVVQRIKNLLLCFWKTAHEISVCFWLYLNLASAKAGLLTIRWPMQSPY